MVRNLYHAQSKPSLRHLMSQYPIFEDDPHYVVDVNHNVTSNIFTLADHLYAHDSSTFDQVDIAVDDDTIRPREWDQTLQRAFTSPGEEPLEDQVSSPLPRSPTKAPLKLLENQKKILHRRAVLAGQDPTLYENEDRGTSPVVMDADTLSGTIDIIPEDPEMEPYTVVTLGWKLSVGLFLVLVLLAILLHIALQVLSTSYGACPQLYLELVFFSIMYDVVVSQSAYVGLALLYRYLMKAASFETEMIYNTIDNVVFPPKDPKALRIWSRLHPYTGEVYLRRKKVATPTDDFAEMFLPQSM